MPRGVVVGMVLATTLVCARAQAGDNDLTLERLIGTPRVAGTAPEVTVATRSAYAGLVSELGVLAAPRPLQPADSLGWSGYAAQLEVGATQVNRDADFW